MSRVGRVVRVGLVAALGVALAGVAIERVRFGATDEATVARVEADVQAQFDAADRTLRAIAQRVATERDTIRAAGRDAAAARRLFDLVEAALPAEDIRRTGLTLYDAGGMPLAWAGDVSELERNQIGGPIPLFVAAGTLGPRLLRLEPIADAERPSASRMATIAVEQALGPVQSDRVLGDSLVVATAIAPVTLRLPIGGSQSAAGGPSFVIRSTDGQPLVYADVSSADLTASRTRWRRVTWAAVVCVLALTLLLGTGRLIERRREAARPRSNLLAAAGIATILIGARLVLWFAANLAVGPRSPTSPGDLLLTALMAAALVWLAVDLIQRRRYARRRARLLAVETRAAVVVASAYLVAGLVGGVMLWGYERFLQAIVARTTLDLLHFSLHPLSASRLALAFALVVLHAAVIWAVAAVARIPTLRWRTPPGMLRIVAPLGWVTGALVGVWLVRSPNALVPPVPLLAALAAAGACALALGHVRLHARRVSQAARLGGLFIALLVPALAMYPSLVTFAIQAKERLVATEYGPQALSLRDDLKDRLRRTLEQIDLLPSLPELVAAPADVEPTNTDRAFAVWSQTDLEEYRLTSSVELYDNEGRLVSRFALDLPEYTTTAYIPAACDWDLFDEISSFGSSERHVLRASRGVCAGDRTVGGVIVRAMLDYRTLPFISSESPYLESLRPDQQAAVEGVSGRDIEFVVYGWSRAPLYVSGTSAWPLPDEVFQRMVDARSPFWATLNRDNERFRVYLMNDRGGIYALGYPTITGLGHLISLAELVTLAGALYVLLVGGATLFNALTSRSPTSGRELLREIRSSFYFKLFLAFVAGAVVPVVILALATRQYFANQFGTGLEESAARTATVAQRLVEDYATLQQRGATALEALDDEIMVLVSRAIDEDVNLFERSQLQATSERDLFASRLLSTRTPSDVYRQILLDRLPTYVGIQEVGGSRYLLAAAPVRAGGRDGVVTVPLTLRQRESERQIDELDRRVLFGALLFSLLGAALGYWMAERIADPVNRLTRATRRIARGDLDARIAATSSDELRRLVHDFNQMAADLKRQRSELERTQRLEAWAEMARQVAHDIKNPLTPIQLSAEHAQRINLDRGRPLSPVLDECVNAILAQVKLLRQIASEFSSFASSPTPHPAPTLLPALLEEVLAPYRTALADRIAIDLQSAGDLPAVTIDRTLFARAVTNVIENALHAMPGKGRLTVASRQSSLASPESSVDRHRSVVVEISDTGVGMDPDALAKIFEPYFSTKATGTGLGLTIAKRNVELNGGTIQVASQRGLGTTVTIVLPLEKGSGPGLRAQTEP